MVQLACRDSYGCWAATAAAYFVEHDIVKNWDDMENLAPHSLQRAQGYA